MSDDDDWAILALADSSLAANLLMRFSRDNRPPSQPPPPALRVDWSVRQPRSRAPVMRHSQDDDDDDENVKRKRKKQKEEPTRASPTTPLERNGPSTSGSGGGGPEETSKPMTAAPGSARSKISIKSEAINAKRSRKKRSLAELRDEETLLLNERKKLRKDIEALRINLQHQKVVNESLSRLKFDLESKQKLETNNRLNGQQNLTNSSHKSKGADTRRAGFSLPDLNLQPDDDYNDSTAAVICGTR